MESLPFNITKAKIIMVAVAIVVVLLSWWMYKQTFIELSIEPVNDAEMTITIVDQNSADVTQTTTSDTHFRKRVPRGDYEVTVQQNYAGTLAIVSTGSFFSTTEVDVTLQEQNQRTYLAHGSASCVNETDNILVSWECGDLLDTTRVHTPATADQPTYKRRVQGVSSWIIESVNTLAGDRYALIRLEAHDGGEFLHGLYPFTNNHNIDVGGGRILHELASDDYYQLHQYKDGFVVFSQNEDNAYYYQGVSDQQPENVPLPTLEDSNGYRVVDAHFSDNTSLLYADELVFPPSTNSQLDGVQATIHEEDGSLDISQYKQAVFTSTNNDIPNITLPVETSEAVMCGSTLLCARVGSEMIIYNVEGEEIDEKGRVTSVSKFLYHKEKLFLVRESAFIQFNPETLTGSHVFTTPSSLCGAESASSTQHILVCATQDQGGDNTLFKVNLNQTTSQPINHVLTALEGVEEVRQLTVQGEYIYVSPNVGDLVPDPETGRYHHDPERVQQAAQAINQKVNELNLRERGYTVINTIPGR